MTPKNKNYYGEKGKILVSDDERKIQCHICGDFYEMLTVHIFSAHNMRARKYKEKFGLNYTSSLMAPYRLRILSRQLKNRPKAMRHPKVIEARKNTKDLNVKYKSSITSGRSLQFKKDRSASTGWQKTATQKAVKDWISKMHVAQTRKVIVKCVGCGKDVETNYFWRNHTFCITCKKIKKAQAVIKWKIKKFGSVENYNNFIREKRKNNH